MLPSITIYSDIMEYINLAIRSSENLLHTFIQDGTSWQRKQKTSSAVTMIKDDDVTTP